MYRSKYEAYPFLSEPSHKFDCDFELLTDKITSKIGLLISKVDDNYKDELLKVAEIVYHFNPTLRTKLNVSDEEIDFLKSKVDFYANILGNIGFVLPVGCEGACISHELRVLSKDLVRLIYRDILLNSKIVDDKTIDIANLLSGYFFMFALILNKDSGVEEIPFKSRFYK